MGSYGNEVLKLIVAHILLPVVICNVQPPLFNPAAIHTKAPLGDCQACKLFVESFKTGLKRTARGKYEGGDAVWEEEKLKKSYKRSEMRLIDIHERICEESSQYSVQCHHMAEKAEEFIEKWWSQDPDESDDLYTYICIDKIKVCCPKNHYGKDCSPCLSDHSKLCSGNGKCRGDGTRKGNGTCLCDTGYTHEQCDQCALGYYQSYSDDNKMLCSPCHKSCIGGCRAGTNKDCSVCRPGYTFDADEGCIDIDECNEEETCKKNEFCMNSIGSYVCMPCHEACKRCHGDGADSCRQCAEGYTKNGDFCMSKKQDEINPSEQMTYARYFTYVGMLAATGILLPSSTTLGSIVGAMVLAYIVGAEYYCLINGHNGLIDLKLF